MTPEEAKQELFDFLPHLEIALKMAEIQNPTGTLQLGVISSNPDGTGRITARFDVDFIKALKVLVGYQSPGEEGG